MSTANIVEYRGYRASMTFDPDDRIIVGRVLDIEDIIGFHGESIAEFEQVFHETIDDYLEACEQFGDEPDQPTNGELTLHIDRATHAAALKAAKRERVGLSQWAGRVLAEAAREDRIRAAG